MRYGRWIAGGTGLALVLAPLVPAEASGTVTLTGTVIDGSGHGWPVYSTVSIDGIGQATTDPTTGHYALDVPGDADYTLRVTPAYPGYQPVDQAVTVGGTDPVTTITVPVDTGTCAAPGYRFVDDGISADFETGTAPAGWEVTDDAGTGQFWDFDNPGGRPNETGGTGGFAVVDSVHFDRGRYDTSLITPTLDLSTVDEPEIAFSTRFFNGLDEAFPAVEVSVDNGTTWTTVWETTEELTTTRIEVPVPAAAGRSTVRVRFHFTGVAGFYWQVDDVVIGHRHCDPVHGGLVGGALTDANTGSPVTGSVTAGDDTGSTSPDGFYWMFSPVTGPRTFTATAGQYQPGTRTVTVGTDAFTRLDWALSAPRITVDTHDVTGSAPFGGTSTDTVTVRNSGTAPAHVRIGERPAPPVTGTAPATRLVHGRFSPLPPTTVPAPDPAAAGPTDGPWRPIADYPMPVADSLVDHHDGLVYSVGGLRIGGPATEGFTYDPGTGTWSPIAPMAGAHEAPVGGFIDDRLYVAEGWNSQRGGLNQTTEAYDPATDTWSERAAPPVAFGGSGHAVLGGRLYQVGGCAARTCGATDVVAYDPDTDTWSRLADYPEPVSWEACGALGGRLYCAGGNAPDGTGISAAYAYDPGADGWTRVADLPIDLWGSAYATANGTLLVTGGVTDDGATVTNQGYAYDPVTDSWSAVPNSALTRYRSGATCGFVRVGGMVDGLTIVSVEAAELPGYDDCDGDLDIPWLRVTPNEFDLAPGASTDITVTMTAPERIGEYHAELMTLATTPYDPPLVAATLTVTPPDTWGEITGTVRGTGCDGTTGPLPDATVQIDTWTTGYTLRTDPAGRFDLWLDARNSPATLIVASDGWQPVMRNVTITAGQTTRADVTLRAAPWAC